MAEIPPEAKPQEEEIKSQRFLIHPVTVACTPLVKSTSILSDEINI